MLTKILQNEHFFALRVFLGFGMLFACSQISIPTYPIPMTMQTVGAILIGFIYNRKEIISSWSVYFALGSMGLPVYYNFTYGFAKLYGPTAGYLLGMFLGSIIISYMKETLKLSLRNIYHIGLMVLSAHITIYISGVSWLTYLIGFEKAIFSGLILLIPSGIIKTIFLTISIRVFNAKSN